MTNMEKTGESTRQLKVAKEIHKAEAVMGTIEENGKALRGELGSKMGKQLRIVPEIIFYLDSSLDYVEHIEELLKK